MNSSIKQFLGTLGYDVNEKAYKVIKACDSWYANKTIADFHKRTTVQGVVYELMKLNFAKRVCSDEANLCEVVEINSGESEVQNEFVNGVLDDNKFQTMYRRQLEKTSADGTVACYVRLDRAIVLSNGTMTGGDIKLNYVDAEGYIPLTVVNGEIIEAAFAGSSLVNGKMETTLVVFTLRERERYEKKVLTYKRIVEKVYFASTYVFDSNGKQIEEKAILDIALGPVKPFAVMQNAEVNNLEDMHGFGLPKLWEAIPVLKMLDLCYNVLFGDLDKADKLLLVNEVICGFDENGKPITPNEQAKKTFVLLGEKLPDNKDIIHEYNPKIRIEEITKTFELLLSLLSMMFGFGSKKYTFENGQIKSATEYIGERQDSMQELNKQREQAKQYIQDICKAIMWFANTYHGEKFDLEYDVLVDFDDSYIEDKTSKLESMRADALSFEYPIIRVWYLMEKYNLSEDEAKEIVSATIDEQDEMPD
ncbi:hypothetical protein ACTQ6A_14210 [Lachnospiraceae bacterium LCP25S3_G4]